MSRAVETTHAAGGLEGLGLGAPIGGGSSSTPVTGGYSSHSSTTTTGTGSGLTGGLTGDHHHHQHNTDSHVDQYGDAHRSSVGAAASNLSKFDTNAQNSTSGDRGIGGGHGGPTAFESDPSAVGVDRRNDGPNSHSYGSGVGSGLNSGSGAYADRDGDRHRTSAGAKASDLKDAVTDRNTTSHSGHHGSGLAAGGLAGGGLAGGAVATALGSRDHLSPQEGLVGDSVTGQQHFAGSGSSGYTGEQTHTSTTTSTTRNTGAGATGLTGGVLTGAAATGVSPGTLSGHARTGSREHNHNRTGSREGGMVGELKKELKDHQHSGGYSEASHHPESDGPHGLVWDSKSNKYVHRRELDNHGSTGVPLR